MPQPAAPPVEHPAIDATAAAAAPAAATAGIVGVTAGGVGLAAGATTAMILAALIAFLAKLRDMHRVWLAQNLGATGTAAGDVAQVIAQEMEFEQAFAHASLDRVARKLPAALAIADPAARQAAVRQILADEQRYAQQRDEAMMARAIAALTRQVLRRDSPLGAFWKLGHAKDHTKGCLFMAGNFWPWAVLDRVHPPRHHGCTSSLHGLGDALELGWMSPGDIPNERDAIRRASGVVMEADDADALVSEIELRDRLVEAGVDRARLSMIEFEGVAGAEAGD